MIAYSKQRIKKVIAEMHSRLGWCVTLTCFIVLMVSQTSIQAQYNLLHKKPYEQLNRTEKGPNTRNWWSSYMQFGFLVPIENQDSLGVKENLASSMFETGWRYKFKVGEHLGIGLDFGYNYSQFRIRQSASMNLLSPGFENEKQLIRLHAITSGAYVRINFGKRGNIIGKYLDLAGNIQYSFRDDMLVRNNVQASANTPSEKIKTVYIDLPFVRDFQYFGTARFGWNFISVFAKYRMSDLFDPVPYINNNRTLPELPSLQIGIEISQNL